MTEEARARWFVAQTHPHAENKAAAHLQRQGFDVYMPRYGGYDPIGITRGVATPGFPALWALFEQRLYLFYAPDARAAFLADPASVIASASAHWSAVRSELAD